MHQGIANGPQMYVSGLKGRRSKYFSHRDPASLSVLHIFRNALILTLQEHNIISKQLFIKSEIMWPPVTLSRQKEHSMFVCL